jgi:hypothetical protein
MENSPLLCLPYAPHYKFKICVYNSQQKNGMVLFVVKILAARDQRTVDSDCFPSVLPVQFGKFQ